MNGQAGAQRLSSGTRLKERILNRKLHGHMWRLLDWVRGHKRIHLFNREFVIRKLPLARVKGVLNNLNKPNDGVKWDLYTLTQALKPVASVVLDGVVKPRLSEKGWVVSNPAIKDYLFREIMAWSIEEHVSNG